MTPPASLYHVDERIPAMPSSLAGTDTAHISFRVYTHTTDPNPNDHLYAELWDSSNSRIGTAQLDIDNLDSPGTWKNYTFDVSRHRAQAVGACGLQGRDRFGRAHHLLRGQRVPDGRHLMPFYNGKNWAATKTSPYLDAYKTFIQALGDHSEKQPGHAVRRHRHRAFR